MNPLTSLKFQADGRWRDFGGTYYVPDAEGCLLIPAGEFFSDCGMIRHDVYEIYPNPNAEVLYLFQAGTYVEQFSDGSLYLLIENCEYSSDSLQELADILHTWLIN